MNTHSELVIYHIDCPDGFGAAHAAWKALGEKAVYIPMNYGMPIPDEVEGKIVYLVDFSYKKKEMEELKSKAQKVILIDHHKTAEEVLSFTDEYLFDINHSGAVLSWRYFHKNKPVPKLLEYIEGVDLWKFDLPFHKEIFSYIETFPYDLSLWDSLVESLETSQGLQKAKEIGEIILRKSNMVIEKIIGRAEMMNFEGYVCPVVNSTIYKSEIGNRLVTEYPPIALIWSKEKEKVIVSIRSDGNVDVSELAKKYGGGGHKAAAAFTIDFQEFVNFFTK